jgi:hypothetical protein
VISRQYLLMLPTQYRTGKILDRGKYAVVKEAMHTRTGKFYACKVYNVKFMKGREDMVCVGDIYYRSAAG